MHVAGRTTGDAMLMAFFVLAQSTVGSDSTYSSAALRAQVAEASIANRRAPAGLTRYRAAVESEMSFIVRDTLGRERAAQIEQLAAKVEWRRPQWYEMQVVGYRSQSRHTIFSTLSLIRDWTVPMLYGERLTLGAAFRAEKSAAQRPPKTPRDPIIAVHPFAVDRDRFYRFSGGDTVTVLRYGGTVIHIMRVRVEPRLPDSTRLAAFDGEIDLDAEQHQIVRMRGKFVVLGTPKRPRPLLARLPGLVGVAYAEFVNKRVGGNYWLPAFQRTEFQSTFALLGGNRAVFRIVSTFSELVIDAPADTAIEMAVRPIHETRWAPRDSIDRFDDWRDGLGQMTAGVSADDFADLAPGAWATTGPPRLDVVPTKLSNVLRFDRIEGLYIGVEANLRLRSAVPGLSVGTFGGWATAERTARGGVHATLRRNPWSFGARAERDLASTNDFDRPGASRSGGFDAALGSRDDFDYVDRRRALASVTRTLGSLRDGLIAVQIGVGDDRAEPARLTRGWLGRTPFRANRAAQQGGYFLKILEAELHPNVLGDAVQPGAGARLHYEGASGTLTWQRVEASLEARQYWRRTLVDVDGRAGMILGATSAPQALFELGGARTLPGYEYKQFVGDRAALFRTFVGYTLPVLSSPMRLGRYFVAPGLAPGFAMGAQGGWTDLSSDAARSTADLLCASDARAGSCRPTGSIRATVGVGLTLFSGAATFGFARTVDRPGPWKFVGGLGRVF